MPAEHRTPTAEEVPRMSWLRYWSPPDEARMWLLCLPPGGGAAHLYRGWAASLPAGVGLVAVELPGHGARSAEPPARRLGDVVEPLAAAVAPLFERPTVLFGHSMGAMVAHELALRLRAGTGRDPLGLVVAGCEAPDRYEVPAGAADAPQDVLLAQVREWGGTGEELLAEPAYRSVLLDVLRADLAVAASRPPGPRPPLDCPVYAYTGTGDPEAGPADAAAWVAAGDGTGAARAFPGGHFFLHDPAAGVLPQLVADLDACVQRRMGGSRVGA
jgi:pyochelin biosynthesis protein PchC